MASVYSRRPAGSDAASRRAGGHAAACQPGSDRPRWACDPFRLLAEFSESKGRAASHKGAPCWARLAGFSRVPVSPR